MRQSIDLQRNVFARQEIAAVPGYSTKELTLDMSELVDYLDWGPENLHLKEAIPAEWLSSRYRGEITVTSSGFGRAQLRVTISGLTDSQRRPNGGYNTIEVSLDRLRELAAEPTPMLGVVELIERWDAQLVVDDINARWTRIGEELAAFLNRCKTLNEAVKLYPQLKLYITPDYIQRMEYKRPTPPTAKQRAEEVIGDRGFVLHEITAAAIAAKLSAAA